MLKLKIEFQVTILLVIIGGMAITLGYLSYRSISEIVSSIHMEAIPDKYLYQIKDLASDLNSLENDIRLYILTNNPDDLESVKEIQNQLVLNIDFHSPNRPYSSY